MANANLLFLALENTKVVRAKAAATLEEAENIRVDLKRTLKGSLIG